MQAAEEDTRSGADQSQVSSRPHIHGWHVVWLASEDCHRLQDRSRYCSPTVPQQPILALLPKCVTARSKCLYRGSLLSGFGYDFGGASAYAKQGRSHCPLSNPSWHMIRGQTTDGICMEPSSNQRPCRAHKAPGIAGIQEPVTSFLSLERPGCNICTPVDSVLR